LSDLSQHLAIHFGGDLDLDLEPRTSNPDLDRQTIEPRALDDPSVHEPHRQARDPACCPR